MNDWAKKVCMDALADALYRMVWNDLLVHSGVLFKFYRLLPALPDVFRSIELRIRYHSTNPKAVVEDAIEIEVNEELNELSSTVSKSGEVKCSTQ